MVSKATAFKAAQHAANATGRVHVAHNLNPYAAMWVCREIASYDPRRDSNTAVDVYVRPAVNGLYVLYRNDKRAMNFAGRVPLYRDSVHAQSARDAAEKQEQSKGVTWRYQPVELHELHDCDWYYVNP